MELTTEQIDFIKNDLKARGITMDDLSDSLLDHICCFIENTEGKDSFYEAYHKAIAAFGDNGLKKTQQKTNFMLNLKKEIIMKGLMFLLGYIAAALCSFSILFKLMHWQGASVILVLGVVILNFGYLPLYFYDRYKRSIA